MRNPENVLSSLTAHSTENLYKSERLYRNLYNQEMFLRAYQNIYSAEGNMTPGSDGKTIDGMSIERIQKLVSSIKDESYSPKPSRRTYIPKKNGKMRPLGIPSVDDKLVQEVVRMILEAIYEGYFDKTSHGFRPNKSCHTALLSLQARFTGCKWFVEGDIKSFFDSIDHDIMIGILRKRIADERFLRLIRKFLKAGYLEDWQFHKTHSGTPQGGIVSPILANIYLDQFDKYMDEMKNQFNKGKERKINPEYTRIQNARSYLTQTLKRTETEADRQDIIRQIKEAKQALVKIPRTLVFDDEYRRLQYVRYADDFLIGIIGSKEDAREIKGKIKQFMADRLKLELSEEKTLITHSASRARFLGFDVSVRKDKTPARNALGRLVRNHGGRIMLEIPSEIIPNKLLEYRALELSKVDGKEVWKATARRYLVNCDDLEILDRYNAEIRGLANYYKIANNLNLLNNFRYIMQYSMYRTFAAKYRTKKANIIKKYRIDKDFGVRYSDKKGREKVRIFYNEGFIRVKNAHAADVDLLPQTARFWSKTNLIDRLKAKKCEWCGDENADIEIHHVRKLKDIKGKNPWEYHMIARNRKTLALCRGCHGLLHSGELSQQVGSRIH